MKAAVVAAEIDEEHDAATLATSERSPALLLKMFKTRFAREHSGQSYDSLKTTPASMAIRRLLLCDPIGGSRKGIFSIVVPTKLNQWADSFLSSVRSGNVQKDAETAAEGALAVAEAAADNGDEIATLIRNNSFFECLVNRKRSFDDILSLPDGSLLQLYRCGVKSYTDLVTLGFDPKFHIRGAATEAKVPVWQLYDLYGFRFERLVDDEGSGGFALPLRDVAESVKMRPPEWALIGASASKFVAMRMNAVAASKLDMTLDQWQRYMDLKLEHAHALGATQSRRVFVEVLKWDADSEWCPAK
jgi:hypothetical protein